MVDPFVVRLAQAFDNRMAREGRKNTWLAELLETSPATIGRLRSGVIAIDFEWAQKIEDALGIERGGLLREAGYFGDEPLPVAAKRARAPRNREAE